MSIVDEAVEPATQAYQVDLGVFSGPLDLLLYLIKKDELNIRDIPIARITRQYLTYIDLMQKLNLELAGEFVLMAATLIRIKTRMLLPRDESSEEETDPREELIFALMEYKRFKEASEMLRERALLEEQFVVPVLPVGKIEGRVEISAATTLYDLVVAYRDLSRQVAQVRYHEVVPEEVSIEDRMQSVLLSLREQETALYPELFAEMPKRVMAVVTFIALLELARTRRIALQQAFPFSELRVSRGASFFEPTRTIDLIAVEVTEE